jgi:pantothenate kinase
MKIVFGLSYLLSVCFFATCQGFSNKMSTDASKTASKGGDSDSTAAMRNIYENLANRLLLKLPELEKESTTGRSQYWIGIAGGPGSGKTTSANTVASILNQYHPNYAVVIPIDGFHYFKTKLLELHGEEGMKRRGAPWTFDVDLCAALLATAKRTGESHSLPSYNRIISDPVPNGVKLEKHHKIVLVEGLYLLYKDAPDWSALCHLWDETWFVKCPTREIQRQRLIERSLMTWSPEKALTWGEGREGATKRVDFNDVQNMDIISHCEEYADEVIVSV